VNAFSVAFRSRARDESEITIEKRHRGNHRLSSIGTPLEKVRLESLVQMAAERFGVEKVKTVGDSYLAVCGLSVQRPDHTNRMIEFAEEMTRIVARYNLESQNGLSVRIGINAGPVVGGVVGRRKFIYDLWGDTVNVARAIRPREGQSAVRVTANVEDRLRGQQEFESVGSVEVPGKGAIEIWQLRLA